MKDDRTSHHFKGENPEKSAKNLTQLILECWQREYDKRPYRHFVLHGKIFQNKMARHMNEDDFNVVLEFLKNGKERLRFFELLYTPFLCKNMEDLVQHLARFESVSLMNVDLPAEVIRLLFNVSFASGIKILRLTGNPFSQDHAEYLRCFLIHNKCLEFLDVGWCSLNEQTFPVVADGVQKSQSLKGVDMSHIVPSNPYGNIDGTQIASIISSLLWRTHLVEVHFRQCGLDCHAIEPICESLMRKSTVKYLDVGSNRIGPEGVEKIFKSLEKTALVGLDLSNNNIGQHGGVIISQHLPFTKLRFLDIRNNRIPAEASRLIVSNLKKKIPLRVLNIFGNQFNNEAAKDLYIKIKARVLMEEAIDVTVTYDECTGKFNVIPKLNYFANYNERYHRVAREHQFPDFLYRLEDIQGREQEGLEEFDKVLLQGRFLGPVVTGKLGKVKPIKNEGESCNSTDIFKFIDDFTDCMED